MRAFLLRFALFVVFAVAAVGGYYFVVNNGPARVTAAWNSLTMKQPAPVAMIPSVPTTSQDEAVGRALAPYIEKMFQGTNANTEAIGKLVGVANTHQQTLDAHGAAIAELQSGLQAVAVRVTPTTEEGIRKVIEEELQGKGLYSNLPPAPVQPPAATGDASPPPASESAVADASAVTDGSVPVITVGVKEIEAACSQVRLDQLRTADDGTLNWLNGLSSDTRQKMLGECVNEQQQAATGDSQVADTPASQEPVVLADMSGGSWNRHGKPKCPPGTTLQPEGCAKTTVLIGGSPLYDVPPAQAHCTIGTTREIWVKGPDGQRRKVHQTCTH
jgi:hypothetical protein